MPVVSTYTSCRCYNTQVYPLAGCETLWFPLHPMGPRTPRGRVGVIQKQSNQPVFG